MSNITATNAAAGRILSLLDAGSFVEIGGAITARSTDFNLQDVDTPGDGVITGYGLIDNGLVFVYSQNADVLGGAIGEMHAKKIANIYDMAMKMGAPVIGLIDSAGMRLQEATDALAGFGTLYLKQAEASGVIPQITAVFGNCGGGLAVVSGLSDFTFMESKGKLFVNSPNAIPGNDVSKCDTSSASFQSEETGIVDGIGTEAEILGQIRALVGLIPANFEEEAQYEDCTDDLNRICDGIENAREDAAIVLAAISDSHVFFETKKNFAKDMVTGFVKLNGMTVGAVANRSKVYDAEGNVAEEFDSTVTARGARKAAEFVNFCDAFGIPVLTLTDTTGFRASKCSEKTLAKAVAKLIYAYANATVPKVNVVTGDAFGSAYVAMNSKSIGADMVYAWPDAQIGMMDASMAAKIMYADADMAEISEKAAEYKKLQTGAVSAARRGYVDTIIAPADTRKYVIGAFEMLYTKSDQSSSKKHGTV